MKHIFILCLLIFNIQIIKAQNDNIYISVAIPNHSNLNNNTGNILCGKLLGLVSKNGVAATESGALIIQPDVTILNKNTIATGMRNIMSVKIGLTLTVRNIITNTVFNTIDFSINGEGYSENEAMLSAFNKVDFSAPRCEQFITISKEKIRKYYANNTSALITKAKTLAAQRNFDEALALLNTYPSSLEGYKQVSETMIQIYKSYQTLYCSQIMLSAEAALAKHDYEEAANIISTIDAQSSCAARVNKILATINNELRRQHKEQLSLYRQNMKSRERIALATISATKDIAKSYYSRQTKFIFIRH